MKRISRILSLILCLALCASLGVTAFAAETTPEDVPGEILALAQQNPGAADFAYEVANLIGMTDYPEDTPEQKADKLGMLEEAAALCKENNLPYYADLVYYVGASIILDMLDSGMMEAADLSDAEQTMCSNFLDCVDEFRGVSGSEEKQAAYAAFYNAAKIHRMLYHDDMTYYKYTVWRLAAISQLQDYMGYLLFQLALGEPDETSFRETVAYILTLAAEELGLGEGEETETWKSSVIASAAELCDENGMDYYAGLLNGMNSTASVLSEGNLTIVIVVAVLALGGVAALVIVKKKKSAE